MQADNPGGLHLTAQNKGVIAAAGLYLFGRMARRWHDMKG